MPKGETTIQLRGKHKNIYLESKKRKNKIEERLIFLNKFNELIEEYTSQKKSISETALARRFGFLKKSNELNNMISQEKKSNRLKGINGGVNLSILKEKYNKVRVNEKKLFRETINLSLGRRTTGKKTLDDFEIFNEVSIEDITYLKFCKERKISLNKVKVFVLYLQSKCGRLFEFQRSFYQFLISLPLGEILDLRSKNHVFTRNSFRKLTDPYRENILDLKESSVKTKSKRIKSQNIQTEYKTEINNISLRDRWGGDNSIDTGIHLTKTSKNEKYDKNTSLIKEESLINESQKKEAKIEPKKIYPQLIGDLLIVECIDLFNLGKSETSICLRCGYSIDNIGKFRRAFSKATKMPFGPLERMLREYKKSSEKIKDLFINRQISVSTINRPLRSSTFRRKVLEKHGTICACCNISIPELIEAAHIVPVENKGNDDPSNGIPLCPTHHAAFDSNLFIINPLDFSIKIKSPLSFEDLNISKETIRLNIDKAALEFRFKNF